MRDRIAVPLELDGFEVVSTEVVEGLLEVEVRSTSPACCYQCGSVEVIGHGRNSRRLRDRSAAYPTVLVWQQRRFRCRDCGRTSREKHRAVAGAKRITVRFLRHLGTLAISQPWTDVAAYERVSWWRVAAAFDLRAAGEPDYGGSPPRVLSLDESAFRRQFRYHTVVSDPQGHGVLDMVEGRDQAAAEQAISRLPQAWRQSVETVVIDCHWPYRKAVEHLLPQARLVADKFHVLRSVDAAAQKVRIRYSRRRTIRGRDGGISRQHNPRFDPRVWRGRWTFMRRRHQLNDEEQAFLTDIFTTHPQIGVAWWMKEAFAAIYQAPNRVEAERRLQVWESNLPAAGLTELTQVWHTLSHWQNQILNYFDDRQTNAYAEGITNKIKVLKRRGYGHRNPTRYRHKVLLACGRRPA